MGDRTIVAIGCSTDRDYNFLAPLTALLWRERIGHEPLLLFVGSEDEWKADRRLSVCLNAVVEQGFTHVFMGRLDGHPDHTLAQNCRQHAAALARVADETWIMPGDADLWPLRRGFYHRHPDTGFKAVLYYANGDHFQGKETTLDRTARGLGCQTLPTCHVAMRAADWRAIYDLTEDDIVGSVKRTLAAWFAMRAAGQDANMVRWMSDQQIMTEALCQQRWFPSGPLPPGNGAIVAGMVLVVNRRGHPPVDRIDRSMLETWAQPIEIDRWTDAHLHKAPDSDAHWADELAILRATLPDRAAWADAYRARYVEAAAK
jgi:hypothetical protein